MITLTDTTETAIRYHAAQQFPRECCGLVAVVKGRQVYYPCNNAAPTPLQHFVLPANEYVEIEEMGEIQAIVHSHPNARARPSTADLSACEASEKPWLIVHVSIPDGGDEPVATEIYQFEPKGFQAPLIGRKFVHGVHDCYAIVRDFYERERGIDLPDFERMDKWWERGETLYMDHFAECGFEEITGPMEPGDVILMQSRSSTPNHAAVYVGNGRIVHHFYGRLSTRDIYGGYWREITRLIIRKVR